MEMKNWQDCWVDEKIERSLINSEKICRFGIKALDDCLIGILKNDLIIIGADAGAGKSDICLKMALHNAKSGKKIALYFIEGGAEEAIVRIKWQILKDKYYSLSNNTVDMDYRKWRMNMIQSDLLNKLEDECFEELKNQIGDNLHIYCFDQGFTLKNLEDSLSWFITVEKDSYGFNQHRFDVDLIIIDHLQYFTLTNPKNELTEMTQILMKVKDITQFHKIPVVLISHLRKKDKDRGLPSQEDFYGTSNIAKIASIAITITPDYAFDNHNAQIYPTFFRIVKSRTGIRSSFAISCGFNFKKDCYENDYSLYSLIMDKPASQPLENHKVPRWARKETSGE